MEASIYWSGVSVFYLFMHLRVRASSCMSIPYCPGVLSGNRAAWSREITVSSRGLVVGGGGGEDGSQLLEP